MNQSIGVIHGRFQALHLGHMEYLLAAKSRCDFLYIGVTNPDPVLSREDSYDPNRSRSSSNPFTYFERLEMIRNAMLECRVDRSEFEIVPFPINLPEILKYYIPLEGTFYLTIYDDWGRRKLQLLQDLGVVTEVMWERSMADRLTTGSDVRRRIANKQDWEHLVPVSVAAYLKERRLIETVEAMAGEIR